MFRIPQKQLIINSNSQLEILKYDGSATYVTIASPKLATDGFFLRGFLPPVLFGSLKAVVSTTLIKSVAGAAGNQQVATFIPNSVTGDCSSENFVILYQSLKLSPVENQNQPLMKHYQVSATMPVNATQLQVATAITNALQADKNAPVTVSLGGSTLTITAKETNVAFQIVNTPANRGGLISGTFTVTTAPSGDIGTYDDLKNLDWTRGRADGAFDVDRNAEYFPVYGQTYKSYRFTLKSFPLMSVSESIPSTAPSTNEVDTDFRIWIANGLTLQTTMDLVVTNANAAN